MNSTRVLSLVIAALAVLATDSSLTAQEVRIQGRVVENETLRPISGARILVSRPGGRQIGEVFTDQHGVFTFTAPEQGGYQFRASRIGYRETETPVLWTDGYADYQVEIRMDPDAVLLAPIEVLARSRGEASPVLEDFWERRDAGLGHYFTRDDIQEIKPSRVTDLLNRVPGVQLQSSGAGLRRVVHMSRGPTSCPAQIFVDGMLWTRPGTQAGSFTVDDAVNPASVLGIEVYRGLASVPAEFLTRGSRCGVIAIWTRR